MRSGWSRKAEVSVTQSCPTPCDLMNCHPPGSSVHAWDSSGKRYWSGQPFPSPGDFLDPGIEPGSLALQADSLLSEPPERTHNRVGWTPNPM